VRLGKFPMVRRTLFQLRTKVVYTYLFDTYATGCIHLLYNNYTKNLLGRSFGTCLRKRLLPGISMRVNILVIWMCGETSAILVAVAADLYVW
jgi:hypothetical protein